MTTQLNLADLAFLLDQTLPVNQGISGVTDPFSLLGLRTIDGTNNNLTNVMVVDQFGNLIDANLFANVNQPFIKVSSSTSPNAYVPAGDVLDNGGALFVSVPPGTSTRDCRNSTGQPDTWTVGEDGRCGCRYRRDASRSSSRSNPALASRMLSTRSSLRSSDCRS